jgi:hypothetical protein
MIPKYTNRNLIWIGLLAGTLSGCVTGHCRDLKEAAMKKARDEAIASGKAPETAIPMPPPAAKLEKPFDRVRVFKYDGSLQCNMGEALSVEQMKKDLGAIKVFSAETLSDGLTRIQVCGSPTGKANVYEISRSELEAAIKLGFKEWTY